MYRFPMDRVTGNVLKGDVEMMLYGNPMFVDGIRGKALSLNGENQYAQINPHP